NGFGGYHLPCPLDLRNADPVLNLAVSPPHGSIDEAEAIRLNDSPLPPRALSPHRVAGTNSFAEHPEKGIGDQTVLDSRVLLLHSELHEGAAVVPLAIEGEPDASPLRRDKAVTFREGEGLGPQHPAVFWRSERSGLIWVPLIQQRELPVGRVVTK